MLTSIVILVCCLASIVWLAYKKHYFTLILMSIATLIIATTILWSILAGIIKFVAVPVIVIALIYLAIRKKRPLAPSGS